MRLTEVMNKEMVEIAHRCRELHGRFHSSRMDAVTGALANLQLKLLYGDEMESYKVKLENFYSETDIKEGFQT